MKIAIGICLTGILCWQFGLFYRFNYLTAKIDGWADTARIVIIGPSPEPCGVPCIGLKEQYGFHETHVKDGLTRARIRGINAYNAEIERFLNKKNGKDWRKRYEAELNELIESGRLE